jgi:hypothetical protein
VKGGQADHERSLLRIVSYTGSKGVSARSLKSHGELYKPALSGPCPCHSRISSIVRHIKESARLLLHLPEDTMSETNSKWSSKSDDQLLSSRERSDNTLERLRKEADKLQGRHRGLALQNLRSYEQVQTDLSVEQARRLKEKSDAGSSHVCGRLT